MMERVEQRMGNYRLLQLLGKGAFADVYLGEHLYLNSPVTIKVLRARLDSPTLKDFLTEARHISHLVHPHIIRVFDFGLEAEAPFLVMDYAPYGNLRQLYPPGTVVPLPTIVSSVMALASALQCAHDQHLVHRDLKPENVLLGSKHEVLLSDFGLALLTSDGASLQVKERFGTLSYMAPELILGQPVPASDQYALAVMVYEWLCGHLPFEGLTAYISNQHLYAVPPSLCEKHAEIPRAVEQVVFKALSKEPAQRFVDVLSFAMALEEASSAFSPPYVLPALRVATPSEASSSLQDLQGRYQSIPLPLTPLIGRERELQAVRDLLLRPEVRMVTLTGTGGIGKTHLALTLGNEVQETFAEGACFVSLSTIYDSELVIPAITQALGLQEREDRSPLELLKSFLRDKQLLVVLDNFEQVLPSAPLLSELLSSCPQLKILVTSRALLHVWGEYVFIVPPLEVPDMQYLPERKALSQIASVALFVQRAKAMLPEFQLTDGNARDVAGICSRLEGVPLALELTATSSNVLSPHALLSHLEHPLEVLTGGRRDAPPRHKTLRNALSWNDDMLSADEQTLFRRLAVFVGGFSLQAAEAIATAHGGMRISVLDGVTALIDKSMLQKPAHGRDEPRLYLLELLREYGLERLAECGELEQTRDAHAAYYIALAEAVELHTNQIVWQELLEHEVKNLRTAVEWLLESGQLEKALRIVAALEQASKVSQESNELNSTESRVRVLSVVNYDVFNQNDIELPDVLFEESDRRSRQLHGQQEGIVTLSRIDNITHKHRDRAMRTIEPISTPTYEELTAREIEVLRLLAMGLSNKQIAERLVLSPHTVSGHIQSIFGKLALNSRSAATRYALEHQLA